MSTGFNWFKSYKITVYKGTSMFDYDVAELEYIGGGDTSHSGGNIGKVQDLIENIVTKEFQLFVRIGLIPKIINFL